MGSQNLRPEIAQRTHSARPAPQAAGRGTVRAALRGALLRCVEWFVLAVSVVLVLAIRPRRWMQNAESDDDYDDDYDDERDHDEGT